nr:MAG TPA: Rho termination factor, N-terminal domain [Bacteriophage sp.]
MKYPYIVNKNGIWYAAGEEVPEDGLKEVEKSTSNSFINSGEKTYTKTEINRMTTSDLQKLAIKKGIANAEEISGAELKKMLIEKFGL